MGRTWNEWMEIGNWESGVVKVNTSVIHTILLISYPTWPKGFG